MVDTLLESEADVAQDPIAYIPSDEFIDATEQDFAQIDSELYADSEPAPADATVRTAQHTFFQAVEHSRLLTFEGEQFLFKRLNFLRFRARALQMSLTGSWRDRKPLKEIKRLLADAESTRGQIACANLRLVTSIVRKHAGGPDEFDEFLAEANTILLKAIDKFDYSRGYRFSTYATHAVRRHVFRLIENWQRRRQRESYGGGMPMEEVEALPSANEADMMRVADATQLLIARFDEVLDKRQQTIVRRRFGLDGQRGESMRAIGDALGLSKERVRQILYQSLEQLAEFARSQKDLADLAGDES